MTSVLDASAVLALLFDEPGADQVRAHVAEGLIGVANLAETLAKLVDRGLPPAEAAQAVTILGMQIVPFTDAQARTSAALRPATRAAGLSLGDRACLALALERGLPAVTAERRWSEIAEAVGVTVEVIR
ncbi:type II toxin-antitoxin system VapC family toxin [Methylobacterium oryzisoli]|uniref:type II toxin-antitoxin system VapC family toxin n=1 Tax=Methylobacterium oryzisoli TaxID=3385502 RepID=UPI0038917FEE